MYLTSFTIDIDNTKRKFATYPFSSEQKNIANY